MRKGLGVCDSETSLFLGLVGGVVIQESADFGMNSLAAESFEKSHDPDRGGGIGFCDWDAISIG